MIATPDTMPRRWLALAVATALATALVPCRASAQAPPAFDGLATPARPELLLPFPEAADGSAGASGAAPGAPPVPALSPVAPAPSRPSAMASAAAALRRLARLDRSRLASLFDAGVAPEPGELSGPVSGVAALPLGVRIPFSKHFGDPGEVRMHPLRATLARFHARTAPSVTPPHAPVLRLDYALPSNPPGVRSIFDEIRRVGPGRYVGWTYLRLPGGRSLRLMPFVLATSRVAI
jgi:hypothetical protein